MRHVLVVDDDPSTRLTYRLALNAAGFDVSLADSASAAIAAIAAIASGAESGGVLLDLNLGGGMTGYDLLGWMRASGHLRPTAVMTAFRLDFDPDEAIALGAVAYADQPLSLEDVVSLANRLTSAPSQAAGPESLHRQVLQGIPGALECLDEIFLRTLPPRLRGALPHIPMEFAVDATEDASLEYGANPSRYDPTRLPSVVDFVYVIARRNLLDRLRAETALKHREAAYAKGQAAVVVPQVREARSDIDLWAGILAVTTDPKERRATELWLDGAGTLSIAQALGYGHLPADGQRAEVKRFKDRLIKRLSRYFGPNR